MDSLIYHLPAKLSGDLKIDMKNISKGAFKALDLNDYARVDLRVRDNKAYIFYNR